MATERPYDPARLIERLHPEPLRSVARRLGIDPAMLCRPWSERQADTYTTRLGLHPGEVWGDLWWHGVTLDDFEPIRRSPTWLHRSVGRLACVAPIGAVAPPANGRFLRRAAGLSAAELAARLHVRTTTLQAWERGVNAPRGDMAEAYGAALVELAEWVHANAERIGLTARGGSEDRSRPRRSGRSVNTSCHE